MKYFYVYDEKVELYWHSMLIIASIAWYIVVRFSPRSQLRQGYCLALLNSFRVISGIAAKQPKSFSQRVLFVTLALYSFIVNATYSSKLMGALRTTVNKYQTSSIEEVVAKKIPYGNFNYFVQRSSGKGKIFILISLRIRSLKLAI